MYGAISHCNMFMIITMKGNRSKLMPAKDKITVKKRVDNPIISVNVPNREKRSFHKLTNLSSVIQSKKSNL